MRVARFVSTRSKVADSPRRLDRGHAPRARPEDARRLSSQCAKSNCPLWLAESARPRAPASPAPPSNVWEAPPAPSGPRAWNRAREQLVRRSKKNLAPVFRSIPRDFPSIRSLFPPPRCSRKSIARVRPRIPRRSRHPRRSWRPTRRFARPGRRFASPLRRSRRPTQRSKFRLGILFKPGFRARLDVASITA